MQDWRETGIWAELERRSDEHCDAVRQALTNHMPDIQAVLHQAATSPQDFTLHDDQHAFRVAERMMRLIPDATLSALCGYELALLLFSAYLHDIGMTPERGLVVGHYDYLLTGASEQISTDEARTFRRWLDEYGRGATPPLMETMSAAAALSTAPRLVTHYCREQHAQWSVDWIANQLPTALKSYTTWRTDLQVLCMSHNEGREFLLSKALDPRIVAPGAIVNMRYLACVLRVADVMEVDPERTPSVLYGHRQIAGHSATYWLKDHELVLSLSDRSVTVTARPPSAVVQRAVIVTADQIDAELYVCRDLADLGSFAFCPGAGPLPHTWPWPTTSVRDIAPSNDAFVYIDGDFQPDTDRILELLGGVALYETPLAALRELLQNAEDAVSEQMARTRLGWDDPTSLAQVTALRALNRIDMSLEQRDDGCWLHCADTGVGMTQQIITNQLLASGSTHGNALADLKRRCGQAGFEFYRTGRFGVGVLSYFMIADEIRIETRRSSETGEAEDHAWEFLSGGLESFGELRKADRAGHGTTVSLRLKAEIAATVDDWTTRAGAYLDDLLIHVPCTVTLGFAANARVLEPGWATSRDVIATRIARGVSRHQRELSAGPDYLSERQRETRARMSASERELREELREATVFDETTGLLEDALGSYRLVIPYFCLAGGNSFAYMRASEDGERITLGTLQGRDLWTPLGVRVAAWNGMATAVAGSPSSVRPYWLEANFTGDAAGRPAVNRNRFELSESGRAALEALDALAHERRQELALEWADSAYRSLNEQIAGLPSPIGTASWPQGEGPGEREWMKVQTPAAPFIFGLRAGADAFIGTEKITLLPSLSEFAEEYRGNRVWWPNGAGPEKMLLENGLGELIPVWSSSRDGETSHPLGLTARFPPTHKALVFYVCDVAVRNDRVWNAEHPIVEATTGVGVAWCDLHLPPTRDPLSLAKEILCDRGRSSAWLAIMLDEELSELWEAIVDRQPAFLDELWAILGLGTDESVMCWNDIDEGSEVTVRQWIHHDDSERVANPLGFSKPPDSWTIQVVDYDST